jgi:hypothetical protein
MLVRGPQDGAQLRAEDVRLVEADADRTPAEERIGFLRRIEGGGKLVPAQVKGADHHRLAGEGQRHPTEVGGLLVLGGEAGPPGKPNPGPEPALLSGGNPQIPKGDGDAPVQAYIESMPGWKHDVGRRLDDLIVDVIPHTQKAVRWNSPFYGTEGNGWFASYHCFTRYVKVTFFNGASLDPLPPEPSKDSGTRYVHIHEDGEVDEEQMRDWIRQAGDLPGWTGF